VRASYECAAGIVVSVGTQMKGGKVPTRFRCPCGQKLKTADDTVGKKARCPACSRWLRVPRSDSYNTVARNTSLKSDKASDAQAALQKMRAMTQRKETPSEPAGPPVGAMPGTTASDRSDSSYGSKAKVIVADSVERDLRSLTSMLRDHGYYVIETGNGSEALELIRSRKPDGAFLDVQLDGLSGFQVAKQLRDVTNPLNKDVWQMPLLMTTQKIRGRDKQYAMSIGVQGYFAKPVNPAQTCSRLEKEILKYRGR